jgi:hypothetical protein
VQRRCPDDPRRDTRLAIDTHVAVVAVVAIVAVVAVGLGVLGVGVAARHGDEPALPRGPESVVDASDRLRGLRARALEQAGERRARDALVRTRAEFTS